LLIGQSPRKKVAYQHYDLRVMCLEQIRRESVDLVVTDLVMPHIDGMELMRKIRADHAFAGTRILAVSASASEYTQQQATDTGSDAFLTKSLRLPALLDCVADLLRLQWQYSEIDKLTRQPANAAGEFLLETDANWSNVLFHGTNESGAADPEDRG
jgi:CheY-like chemotaxis protein